MPHYYYEIEDLWERQARIMRFRTSGSTGTPKDISLSRRTLSDSARRTIRFFGLTEQSRLHSCISPETIGGAMVRIRALECGGDFSYEAPSNRPLYRFNRHDRFTMVSVVPSQMLHILKRHEEGTLPQIEAILIGGSPIPPGLRKSIIASGLPCWESYGMTETASHVAVRRVADETEWFSPLPGIRVHIGSSGCLNISGVKRTPIFTNDLAEMDAEGRFRIMGRKDNVIISGGRKIIPEEVEDLLRNHMLRFGRTADYDIAVTGIPDEKWGRQAAVVYECRDFNADDILQLLMEAAEEISPHWKQPRRFIRLPSIPRTKNGKLDRKALSLLMEDQHAENNSD